MKISILCSSKEHPIYPWLEVWIERIGMSHEVVLVEKGSDLTGGDILFLISANEIIRKDTLSKYRRGLVIHASELPKGRGWSPHIWQILEGKNEIVVTLLEAAGKVDTGAIWSQKLLKLEGHELADEINARLFDIEIGLMDYAVENFYEVKAKPQPDTESTTYRKRIPADSRFDPNKSIAEQFDLLRVADNKRFPAFIDFRGYRYEIKLEKKGKSI